MKTLFVCILLWTATAAGLPRGAAAEWPPESFDNLQVLPEDITVPEITGMMRGFAGGLGVRCTYCHVGDDPNDLRSMDFASDEKVEKRKAREMIRMVQRINDELLAELPARSEPPVAVTCRTCHHGLTRPVDIRDILAEALESNGAEATIARYEELREKHYGSDSYDFRHFMLANVAERVGSQNPAGAIRLLEYNATLHPGSGQTFFTMAQIYRGIDDIDGAIRSLEKAVEAEPEIEFYRRTLERLRARKAEAAAAGSSDGTR